MSRAYYNEIDPFAAAWLRELIKQGHIAPGDVDERSIIDIKPGDLAGYTQCHFFAGIGVWSYALRQAGWSDGRPVWTGSCPCQPFSAAGKGAGFDDERHLWPAWQWLIQQCRPAVVFGEQVASKAAESWIDLVHADLEAMGYAFGCVPFPSAGIGAPHIRDRNYWLAYTSVQRCEQQPHERPAGVLNTTDGQKRVLKQSGSDSASIGGVVNSIEPGLESLAWHGDNRDEPGRVGTDAAGSITEAGGTGRLADSERITGRLPDGRNGREVSQTVGGGEAVRLANTEHPGHSGQTADTTEQNGNEQELRIFDGGSPSPERQPATGPTNGFWGTVDWLYCRDGKWRPVEPGTFPLVNGAPARVGRLRGYGNAINAEAAKTFIETFIEVEIFS